MSAPILRPVGPMRPIWSPEDGRKTAEDAAKHKPVRLRDWAWAPILIAAGILLPGLTAPQAQANPVTDAVAAFGIPVVCATLDEFPSADGVAGVVVALVEEGYSPGQAGDIVAKSVVAFCDEHIPDVEAFVAEYGTNTQGQAV